MATNPSEAEAWLELQAFAGDLDLLKRPPELRKAMITVLSKKWDMSKSGIDFRHWTNFWIEPKFRSLVTRLAKTGPGKEVFNISTLNQLRTCRLEGVCKKCLLAPLTSPSIRQTLGFWVEILLSDVQFWLTNSSTGML